MKKTLLGLLLLMMMLGVRAWGEPVAGSLEDRKSVV